MIYRLTTSFMAISEVAGVIENLSNSSNVEVAISDSKTPKLGSGVSLKPGQKMAFECEKANRIYARLVTNQHSDKNPAVMVVGDPNVGQDVNYEDNFEDFADIIFSYEDGENVLFNSCNGSDNEGIVEWMPSTAYKAGTLVIYHNEFLRAVEEHTSTDIFDPDLWEVIGGSSIVGDEAAPNIATILQVEREVKQAKADVEVMSDDIREILNTLPEDKAEIEAIKNEAASSAATAAGLIDSANETLANTKVEFTKISAKVELTKTEFDEKLSQASATLSETKQVLDEVTDIRDDVVTTVEDIVGEKVNNAVGGALSQINTAVAESKTASGEAKASASAAAQAEANIETIIQDKAVEIAEKVAEEAASTASAKVIEVMDGIAADVYDDSILTKEYMEAAEAAKTSAETAAANITANIDRAETAANNADASATIAKASEEIAVAAKDSITESANIANEKASQATESQLQAAAAVGRANAAADRAEASADRAESAAQTAADDAAANVIATGADVAARAALETVRTEFAGYISDAQTAQTGAESAATAAAESAAQAQDIIDNAVDVAIEAAANSFETKFADYVSDAQSAKAGAETAMETANGYATAADTSANTAKDYAEQARVDAETVKAATNVFSGSTEPTDVPEGGIWFDIGGEDIGD